MGAVLSEITMRVKYVLLCLFAVDGSWDMGAHLTGSIFPWGGYWVNGEGVFDRYSDIESGALG